MFRDIAKVNNEDLKTMTLLELTIMNRILISLNTAGDLSNHIETYLMLKKGESDFDHILLFLSMIKLSN